MTLTVDSVSHFSKNNLANRTFIEQQNKCFSRQLVQDTRRMLYHAPSGFRPRLLFIWTPAPAPTPALALALAFAPTRSSAAGPHVIRSLPARGSLQRAKSEKFVASEPELPLRLNTPKAP